MFSHRTLRGCNARCGSGCSSFVFLFQGYDCTVGLSQWIDRPFPDSVIVKVRTTDHGASAFLVCLSHDFAVHTRSLPAHYHDPIFCQNRSSSGWNSAAGLKMKINKLAALTAFLVRGCWIRRHVN